MGSIGDGGDFGREIAHAAVSRRPPNSLHAIVPRTHMYTYDANVWDLSIVQRPFSVAPCLTRTLRFATCPPRYCVCASVAGAQWAERGDLRKRWA